MNKKKPEEEDDQIVLCPVVESIGKEASEDVKVFMDKTGYEEPQEENPLDKVNPDLHSK